MVASECNRLRDLFIYMITEQVNEIATSTCLTEQKPTNGCPASDSQRPLAPGKPQLDPR